MTNPLERPFHETGDQTLGGLPVDRAFLTTDHDGRANPGIEKRQAGLLGKLSFLSRFLKKDEKIVLVTSGCSPMSAFEQVLTGSIVYYLKRSLIVFTDRGIFHVPTKSDFSYRNSIARIDYSNCREISMKRSFLEIRYGNGTRERFTCIDRRERKKIRALLAAAPIGEGLAVPGERRHLCPRCTAELVRDRYTCPECRLVFKNRSEGRRKSILYPGGGYFYTGHPFLGTGDAITEGILLVLAGVSLANALGGAGGGFLPPAVWGIALIVEKAISVYHSNHFIKEYIPDEPVVLAQGHMK